MALRYSTALQKQGRPINKAARAAQAEVVSSWDEKSLKIAFYFKTGLITIAQSAPVHRRCSLILSPPPPPSKQKPEPARERGYIFDNAVQATLLTIFEQAPTEA